MAAGRDLGVPDGPVAVETRRAFQADPGRGSSSTSYPASTQASRPPANGRTLVNPLSMSARATRAAEASFGQVQ